MCETCKKVYIEVDSVIGWISITTRILGKMNLHTFCSAPCAIKFLNSL